MTGYYIGGGVLLALLILISMPQCFLRFIIIILRLTLFNVRITGKKHIPKRGGALLVANHIAFFDALMIMAATLRPVRFMVHEQFFRYPVLRLFFWYLGVLKVPSSQHVHSMKNFVKDVQNRLSKGEVICTFPEGGISDNGLLQEFRGNIFEFLPADSDIPVIPIHLGLLWGKLFAVDGSRVKFLVPRHFPPFASTTIREPLQKKISGFELRQIISEMGAECEAKPFPGERPLHAQFARRTRFRPWIKSYKDFGAKAISDFSLLIRSLILSKIVRQHDPNEAGGYVGVLLPNSTIQIATLLGTLYGDRTPAVLNYTAGIEAVKLSIAKADIKLIITSRQFLEKLNMPALPEMIFLEDVAPTISKSLKIRTMLAVALLPSSWLMRIYSPLTCKDVYRPTVLLFSSGSTGNPKGVMLSSRNITSDILGFWRSINWTPNDKILGSLPLFHAFGFTVCFAFPLLSGTQTSFIPNILDAANIVKLIRKEAITLLITTPTFLQSYMRKASSDDLKSLRLVITGAEKLRRDIIDKFYNLTQLTIVEGYGCTELSPIVCVNLSKKLLTLGKESGMAGSIGVAMPGIHTRIVDPDSGETLSHDESGLLQVKGALVMLGYLNDPVATAAAITPDGYYNTGDIASLGVDGSIVITGRLSRFSKIGGEMVPHELLEQALGEILESEERVVAVTGTSDPKRGEKLIVFHKLQSIDIPKIASALRDRDMPNLWIPKADDFIYIEHLPTLGSGKLDLQKLKKLAENL